MSTAKPLIDKDESRRIGREIRRVFLELWDPIGVADEPNAQDEYDDYVGPVYELLVGSATDEEIVTYLFWVVDERMGLGGTRESKQLHQEQLVAALRQVSVSRA